jgi:predicted RNA binding protein YcfA (HicA-like mRNA interferase family)
MKLPRDLSGADLIRPLSGVDWRVTRQTGSYVRLTTDIPSQRHSTVPAQDPLKDGTLAGILGNVAAHRKTSHDELLQKIIARAPDTVSLHEEEMVGAVKHFLDSVK